MKRLIPSFEFCFFFCLFVLAAAVAWAVVSWVGCVFLKDRT